MNRQNAAARRIFFFLVMHTAYWRTESFCVIRRCTANRKKTREIKLGNNRRCKFGPHYLLAQDASLRQYTGAAQVYPSLILQQISWTLYGDNNSPSFAYSSGHYLQYWFCFIWAETEIPKIKDDIKIKREKNINRRGQRNIVNVWHLSVPPFFSLSTTFKRFKNSCSAEITVLYRSPLPQIYCPNKLHIPYQVQKCHKFRAWSM